MVRLSEKLRVTLSEAKKTLLYKTPMGDDTLFGDCKIRSEKSNMFNNRAYSETMRAYPWLSEHNASSYDEFSGYSSSSNGALGGCPLADGHHVRFMDYSSRSGFSVQNGERAPTTTSKDLKAASLPFSRFERSRRPVSISLLQTCNICAEERQSNDFPTTPVTPTCTHPVTDACKECVRRHLASQLSSRGTSALSCICNQPLSLDDVQRNADPMDFARYCERATMELLESDSQFVWCPAQGCGAGQLQQRGSDEPKVTCARCWQPYCFTHRVRWHVGMTCREFDQTPELADAVRARENAEAHSHARHHRRETQDRDDEQRRALKKIAGERREREAQERENESFVRQTSRPCPSCRYMAQKDGGCKHVTCKLKNYSSCLIAIAKCWNPILGVKCQFEFCWKCKKAWTTGHLSVPC